MFLDGEEASTTLDKILRQDRILIDMKVPTKPLSLVAYVEDCSMPFSRFSKELKLSIKPMTSRNSRDLTWWYADFFTGTSSMSFLQKELFPKKSFLFSWPHGLIRLIHLARYQHLSSGCGPHLT